MKNKNDIWQPVTDHKFLDQHLLPQLDDFCKSVFTTWAVANKKIDEFFEAAEDAEMKEIREIFSNNLHLFSPCLPWDPYRVEWHAVRKGSDWLHKPTGCLITCEGKVIGRLYNKDILWPTEKFTDAQKQWCKNHNLSF